MALDKPIEQIVEADLRELIENQFSERKTIEYKQSLLGGSEGDRKEFLADVSSFANTAGGHLLYGLNEQGGVPVELCGLETPDTDSLVASLDNRIRDGIKPRIPGVVVWPVKVQADKVALVIRVPRSFASPHMVTYGGTSRFYARNSNGKYQLDVDEIRAAFLLSDAAGERVREFRLERIAKIQANETPVPLPPGARVVLHFVPLDAFSAGNRLEPTVVAGLHPNDFPLYPLGHQGWQSQGFNFEGVFKYVEGRDRRFASGYLQIFRSGILEGVNTSLLQPYDGRKRIPSVAFEEAILKTSSEYLVSLHQLQVDPPMAVMLTLLGVSGYGIGSSQGFYELQSTTIDRDVVLIPELMLDGFDVDMPSALKQTFDMVWNAAGWARSMCYDEKGMRKKSY